MNTLTSPVTWAIIGTFVIGGLNAVLNLVPAGWAAGISAAIAIIGVLIHKDQIKQGKVK